MQCKQKVAFTGKAAVFMVLFLSTDAVLANPVLDNVAAGNATVVQSGNNTDIHQTSDNAIINWQSFNIGANEKTTFHQPNANSITLNRIDPQSGASQIFGQLSANGKIILVNQAGIFFGPGSRVDVGGIIASTTGITNQNFLAGKFIFDQTANSTSSVINQGTIKTADYGLVALLGASVENSGFISAQLGSIALASGSKFTLSFTNDGLINFSVDQAAQTTTPIATGVKNTGSLMANGGTVLLTAKGAQNVLDNAINTQGLIEAQSVAERHGEIILAANDGNVTVSGTLNAAGTRGGKIIVSGKQIHLSSSANVNANGDIGGGEILIGGNMQGIGPLPHAWDVSVDAGALLQANAITQGNGGKIVVWSDHATQFYGNISARGGATGGNGGFAETSGKYLTIRNVHIDLSAPHGLTGTWLLDPENVTIQDNSGTNVNEPAGAASTYTPTGDDAIIDVANLEAALVLSNVVITTGAIGGQSGDITVSDPITWASTNSLTLSAYRNININAAITGSQGALILQADNTNLGSGVININADISTAALTANVATTFTGTRVITTTGNQTYSGDVTLDDVTFTGNDIQFAGDIIGGGTSTLTVNESGNNSYLNGTYSGLDDSTSINLAGPGTFIFNAINPTYSSPLNITGGIVKLVSNTIFSTPANAIFVGSGILELVGVSLNLGGNSLVISNGSGEGILASGTSSISNGAVVLGSGSGINVANNGTLTISALLTGARFPGNSLVKKGNGTLVLTNNTSTYNGSITVNAGTLEATAANALGSGTNITLNAGGLLKINNTTLSGKALVLQGGTLMGAGAAAISGTINLTADSTISTAANSDVFTVSSTVNGGYALLLAGAGTLEFAGALGAITPLVSFITSSFGTTTLDGNVTTLTNQTYNNLLALGGDVVLTSVNGGNLTLNNGITGGNHNLTLIGQAGNTVFTLGGSLSGLNNVVITGNNGGNNTLALNTNDQQIWDVGAGSVSQLTGVNSLLFTYIQNLNSNNAGTLRLANQANTVHVTAAGQGSVTGLTSFSGFTTLIGTSGSDQAVFDMNSANYYIDSAAGFAVVSGVKMWFTNIALPTGGVSKQVIVSGTYTQDSTSLATDVDMANAISIVVPSAVDNNLQNLVQDQDDITHTLATRTMIGCL